LESSADLTVKIKQAGKISLLTALGAIALTCCVLAPAERLIVKTAGGKIHGKLINRGKVNAYQGIPYAAPPVGKLRWQAPQPVLSWNSMFDATKYGHRCAQNAGTPGDSGSEDCLTLNVYAPAGRPPNAKLPVMFWIHGGGYSAGASSEPRHNGDFLPLKGVVLVTINYRLGVFGFLALPELASEQRGASGNYGLMDMVAALRWVKKNIAAFGGDPDCVTIFGESAGSFAVSTLMAAPSAQGLFHRAIGESGGALNSATLSMGSLAVAGAQNAAWAKEAGANTLDELRALSTERILALTAKNNGLRFLPVIDGTFLSESVLDTYKSGKQAKVPLLAGFNRDEDASLAMGMSAQKWNTMAKQRYTDKADAFLQLYPGPTDEVAMRSAADFGGDQFIAYGTWKWMEIDRKTGNKNIYRYKFDMAAPPNKSHWGSQASHADDIEYVFGTLDTLAGVAWRPEDYALSEQMMSYWTNFARTGDPNGIDGNGQRLPEWPKYTYGDPVLHLDQPTTSRPDENRGRYEFWENSEK
jgi:para-nitrobenzyl esterase